MLQENGLNNELSKYGPETGNQWSLNGQKVDKKMVKLSRGHGKKTSSRLS